MEANKLTTINATHFDKLQSFSSQSQVMKNQSVFDAKYKNKSLEMLESHIMKLKIDSLKSNDSTKYSDEIMDLQQRIDDKKIEASKTLTQEQKDKIVELFGNSSSEALDKVKKSLIEQVQNSISTLKQNQNNFEPRDVNLEIKINQTLAKAEFVQQMIRTKINLNALDFGVNGSRIHQSQEGREQDNKKDKNQSIGNSQSNYKQGTGRYF
jgi:hypothetical protein